MSDNIKLATSGSLKADWDMFGEDFNLYITELIPVKHFTDFSSLC